MIPSHSVPNIFQPLLISPPSTEIIRHEQLRLESKYCPLLSSPPLSTLADLSSRSSSVVITVTDATRPSPDRLLLQLIRKTLDVAGVKPEQITLLCATGLHRPMSRDEAIDKLGEENLRGVEFVNHAANDKDQLVEVGVVQGIPVVVNRRCVEADLLIALGVVEPHQYAGFSGGAKSVVIGCGGETTIQETHGIGMIGKPGTQLTAIRGNPFQSFVREGGKKIGLRYVLNVALNGDGEIVGSACGDPTEVHDYLAAMSLKICRVDILEPASAALVGVPESKGTNLYQASRAATYLSLAERSPLRFGGPIIIPATIREGAGDGIGEKHFFDLLSRAESPATLIREFEEKNSPAGGQRAYIVARTLQNHPIIVAGAEHPEVVRACHMIPAIDLDEALNIAEDIVRQKFGSHQQKLLLIENGLTTIPRLAEQRVE
ncbi:MAG: lactate racemase domain-containing protein [Candidatus Kapaibacterium sp.]